MVFCSFKGKVYLQILEHHNMTHNVILGCSLHDINYNFFQSCRSCLQFESKVLTCSKLFCKLSLSGQLITEISPQETSKRTKKFKILFNSNSSRVFHHGFSLNAVWSTEIALIDFQCKEHK